MPTEFSSKEEEERPLPVPTMPFIKEEKAFPEVPCKHLCKFLWPVWVIWTLLPPRESGSQLY